MKKFFYSVLAVATMLFATTSCSQEDEILGSGTSPGGNTQKVTFKVGVPDEDAASRAIADGVSVGGGNKADNLIWALYEKGKKDELGNPIKLDCGHVSGTQNDATGKHEFVADITMVKGLTYEILFFAYDDENCAFQLASTVKETDLTALTLNDELVANEESYDAFVKCHPYTFGGETDVVLTRPFAQINAATTLDDLDKAKKLQAVVTTSELVINDVPTQYNVLTGEATSKANLTYKANEILTKYPAVTDGHPNEDITVNEVGYKYLTMAYVLAGETKDSKESMHNATFKFYRDGDANSIRTIEFPNLPIQRNYRTNVVGDLITRTESFKIVIDEGFGGDINKVGVINGLTYIRVKNAEEFNAAFVEEKYDMIILDADIALTASLSRAGNDPTLTISAGKTLTIDLNGKKLSAISSETGKNYNMFDVRGTLTVKNGTVEYQHTGGNMAWNNFAEIFYVGFNGTLNLDDVEAKNMGGSDMAYVIDMVNATNITVNVENSTLYSTYIPIRVFNNSKNGVNNVVIKNTTLEGKYCFWVQYYLSDGRDQETLDQTLNLDIYNSKTGESNSNTFKFTNSYDAPVLYGFNEAVYFDQYGDEISLLTPIEGAEGVALDKDGNYVITEDIGMASISALIAADENNFAGKTIILGTDVDLANAKTMGDSFAPIGSTGNRDDRDRLVCEPFKGTFDGKDKTIKGLYQSGWDMGYEWGQYGSLGLFAELESATVKNVVLEGFEAQVEGGDISFVAGSATGDCVFENIKIKNSKIGTYNNGCGGIIGWSGAGTYTFKNIKLDSDVVLGGLWGSFDSSIGGIVGQAEPGATYNFENVEINCRIDAYNDCTASYDYYNYRMCGMIIGRCEETTTIDGKNYPDLSKYNMTFNNVTVNYGTWMNYHYCEPTPGHNNGRGMRVEPGFAYGGLPADFDHTQCVDNHYNCIPFDQLIGGDQLGVKGLPAVDGVTVNYPAEYDCTLCGNKHNKK